MPPLSTPKLFTDRAKHLRRHQTDAEKWLWHFLRNRQIAQAKFRRQHVIEGYIVDFYCHEHLLAIELDGGQHFSVEGLAKDAQRTARLNALGVDVLRFDNYQVLMQREAVLQVIYDRLQEGRCPHPSPLPKGEGVNGVR